MDENFVYLVLKVKLDKVDNDALKELEALISTKNAVLCKIQKIIPTINLTTIAGDQKIRTIDEIINRNPLDTLKEAFTVVNKREMNELQEKMLSELIESLKFEN